MAHPRNNGEFFVDYGSRVSRRNRRLGRFTKPRLSESALLLIALLSISLTAFGLRMYFLGEAGDLTWNIYIMHMSSFMRT